MKTNMNKILYKIYLWTLILGPNSLYCTTKIS